VDRIVSLVPSHTESLHALGLAERVVGRTRFCIHPESWVQQVPHVGGTKDARLERILELRPDLVVADKDENPLALVEALQEHGVEVLWSEIDTVADAAAFLRTLAARCAVAAAGEREGKRIESALASLRPKVRFPVFCPIWHRPWMTFDRTAYPHAMLDAVGFDNVFANHTGSKYFEVQAGEVAASAAQWMLLPTEPFPFHKHPPAPDEALGLCGRKERMHIIDGEALTWFGTRTTAGLHELARVHAELQERV
jgi:iron complex transport system substrate-binding protein